MIKEILLYRVLGLPTPEQRTAVKSGQKQWSGFGKGKQRRGNGESQGEANPWIVDDMPDEDASEPSQANRVTTDVPWVEHDESRRDTFFRVALRVVVYVVLFMLILTGLRSWFFDRNNDDTKPTPVPAAAVYPQAAASGVAERAARSYLSWDEDHTDQRAAQLDLDFAPDALKENAGWNQRGKQTVNTAATLAVNVTDESTARVTVAVLVTPWAKEKGKWEAGDEVWRTLEMPVIDTTRRLVVPTLPALVGMPAPDAVDLGEEPDADSAATTASRPDAQAFFESYGTKADVSALTAPGEDLTGLGDKAATMANLREWTVYTGDDKTRSARAVVEWEVGDTTLTQPYDLTLVAVAQGEQRRWQIASVGGGNAGKETT